ncbi:MAG: NUDIX hydrolase [Actinomycetota bacterium]
MSSTNPTTGDPEVDPIRAAGCLVYRARAVDEDTVEGWEVLVIHRPRHDDWDLPKGKLEAGEDELTAAVRETEEETGYTGEIGPELPTAHYQVGDRPKSVHWWLLHQTGGSFVANEEVDRVEWLTPAEAAERLSYPDAVALLDHLP